MATPNLPQPAPTAGFPTVRPRRLRSSPLIRNLVRETSLHADNLILPMFVRPGRGIRNEISSMPGNFQLSTDTLVEEVGIAKDLGVRSFMLFGIPATKDATGSSAINDEGIVQLAIKALRVTGSNFSKSRGSACQKARLGPPAAELRLIAPPLPRLFEQLLTGALRA